MIHDKLDKQAETFVVNMNVNLQGLATQRKAKKNTRKICRIWVQLGLVDTIPW